MWGTFFKIQILDLTPESATFADKRQCPKSEFLENVPGNFATYLGLGTSVLT